MKRSPSTLISAIILLILLCLPGFNTQAQVSADGFNEWTRVDPPTWRDFSSIEFASDGIGWLFSPQSDGLYRTDQSNRWVHHETLDGDWELRRDGDDLPLFLIGPGGEVLIYMDEQLEWMPIFHGGPDVTIHDVAALPLAEHQGDRYGWTNFAIIAVGERVAGSGIEPYVVAFQPPARGWREVSLPGDDAARAVTVRNPFRVDDRSVIVAVDTALFISDDDAFTFKRALMPAYQEDKLRDVAFYDENRGWAVGDDGTMLWTRSGGHRWFKEARPTRDNFARIHVFDWTVFVLSDSGQNRGELWTMSVLDDKLTRVELPFNDTPRAISQDWRDRRWLVGDRGMIYIQGKRSEEHTSELQSH